MKNVGLSSLLLLVVFMGGLALPCRAQNDTPPKQNKESKKENKSGKDKDKKDQDKDEDEKKQTAKPLPQLNPDARYDYQGEATFVLQHLFAFHSPYEGPNSLRSRDETELTHTYTLFLGARLVKNVEVFVNPELAWGRPLSSGQGLGGFTNGDEIGQTTLRPEPYFARYFVRWRIPLPGTGAKFERDEQVGRAPNIIDGKIPTRRIVVTLGKFAVSDIFDANAYANNPRQQFLNNAFGNNLAYDFAQETRGYNLGLAVAWVNPDFAVRFGTFAMPTAPGGPDLAYNGNRAHSEQLEVELHPQLMRAPKPPLIARLLGYRNVGTAGRYADALAQFQTSGADAPDVTMARSGGRVKYGFGLNLEQGLADGGATGVFARLGWNDGATESSNYEADRFVSLGAQLSGAHWRRKDDRVGLAFGQADLSAAHKNYLAAGGTGLTVGDGKLRYGSERQVEAYYSYQVTKPLALTLDYQFLNNPGYNRDRGPASVISLRAHVTF